MSIQNRNESKNKPNKRCLQCGLKFGKTKMFWKRKFCSDKCRAGFFYNKLKNKNED